MSGYGDDRGYDRGGYDRDDRRGGGYDDRRGGYDERYDRGGYDRGYDDRRGGYDDRNRGSTNDVSIMITLSYSKLNLNKRGYDRRDDYDRREERRDNRGKNIGIKSNGLFFTIVLVRIGIRFRGQYKSRVDFPILYSLRRQIFFYIITFCIMVMASNESQ